MAKYLQNKLIKHNRKSYEITWLTPYVLHINKNIRTSHLPHLDFQELETYAARATFIQFREDVFIGFFRKEDKKLYQIIAYFEQVKKHYRCIIKTGYLTTDQRLVTFAKENGI